jgi:hypothetical protein
MEQEHGQQDYGQQEHGQQDHGQQHHVQPEQQDGHGAREGTGRTSRRRILAGGGAAFVAAMLSRTGQARAADGQALVLGQSNSATSTTELVRNGATAGDGLRVSNDSGTAIHGVANGTSSSSYLTGVEGTGSIGVLANGVSTGPLPDNYGVYATGVKALYGLSYDPAGFGAMGVGAKVGVSGVALGTDPAAGGEAGTLGVRGQSHAGYGVYGESTQGAGVVGKSTSGPGLQGFSGSQAGLTGSSDSSYGAFGVSGDGPGLGGFSSRGIGGYFQTQARDQWAAYADNAASGGNGLFVNGNFVVANGTKSGAVDVDGELHLLYALEAPVALFEDFGVARLERGAAHVELDPVFARTIDAKADYHVFVTPRSAQSKGLAVVRRTARGFTVRELGSGSGSYVFDYRIVAQRRGMDEGSRLKKIPRPQTAQRTAPRLQQLEAARRPARQGGR